MQTMTAAKLLTSNMKPPIRPQYRSQVIGSVTANDEARTIDVAFSSENPVERFYGIEILEHKPDSIRLQRFQSGGPVLVDHDPRQQIGVIEKVSLDADKVARATIRFSRNARAEQEWQDVQDGIRRHISVGYMVHKLQAEPSQEDVFRAVDWEPLEISFVAIPADTSVGVGRDYFFNQRPEEETMSEQETNTAETQNMPDNTRLTVIESYDSKHDEEERTRVREITALCELFNATDFSKRAIETGISFEACRTLLQERIKTKPSKVVQASAQVDWSTKEANSYSLLRAIQAHVNHDWRHAGLEREVSLALAEQMKREPRGFFMPLDLDVRLQQVKDPKLGGHLVATELLSSSFIDVLRNTSLLPQLGATLLTNLQGNIDIPKQLTSSNFVWVDEDADSIDTELKYSQIGLKPKTITGSIPITRRLLKQSSLDIEFLVRRDLALGVALAIDKAMFMGKGTDNEPEGILKRSDITRLEYEDVPTFRDVVELETAVSAENALSGTLAYVGHTTMTGLLKTKEISEHTAQFILQNNTVNGYRYVGSNQLPRDLLLFGNFGSIIMGLWGVLDVVPDTATKVKSGGLVIRVFQDVDMNLRYSESFALLQKIDG